MEADVGYTATIFRKWYWLLSKWYNTLIQLYVDRMKPLSTIRIVVTAVPNFVPGEAYL